MGAGTSIPGFQEVLTDGAFDSRFLFVQAGDTTALVPRRLGYFYVFLMLAPKVGLPTPILVQTGLIYEPGMYLKLTGVDTFEGDTYRCVASWNIGGVVWDFSVFS